jgi:uncharacterized repeat protein (TIGR03803 family)
MDLKPVCRPLFHSLVVVALSILTLASEAHATKLVTLYQFTDGADGGSPYGGVVQDTAGVLYGTTGFGGGNSACSEGCGTVYSFSRTAGLKTLVTFNGANGGRYSSTLLLNGTTLYGTSGYGAYNDGVVFSVHTDGSGFTLLHQFSGADGNGPTGTPQLGANGTVYGVALYGGINNQGVLFSIKPDGTYTVLHQFTGGADGGSPTSLLMSRTGTLVGTTFQGGADSICAPPTGCGVLFSYKPATGKYMVLHTSNAKSSGPLLGSIGPGQTVYGTAVNLNGNDVFALSPSGFKSIVELTVYHSGVQYPGPTLAPDGSLLLTDGSNSYGGGGNLLRIQNGKVTGDVVFNNNAAGTSPSGQPIISNAHTIIGTTYQGGLCSTCGTIYEVTP